MPDVATAKAKERGASMTRGAEPDPYGRWTVEKRKDLPSNYPWRWIIVERKTGKPFTHFDDFTNGPYVPGFATEEKAWAKIERMRFE